MEKLPPDLHKALLGSELAYSKWKDITPVARRDFVSWIESAKQEETRKRRISVTCSKLIDGKRRPCCYAVVPMNLYKALNTNLQAKSNWKSLSPLEHRDFVDWIDEVTGDKRSLRIGEACIKLSSGKRRP